MPSWASLTDTAPFDRLGRMAVQLVDAPMAMVSLVREGAIHPLSWTGIPEPWASAGEIPQPYLFCDHVFRTGQIDVIPDTAGHPRLQPGSAGDQLGVRSYLGIPLKVGDDRVVGVFAVMDTRPHPWSAAQIEALRDLAQAAVTEIELRARTEALERASREREEREAQLRDILESITDQFFALDAEWRITYINRHAAAAVEQRMGRSVSELIGRPFWDVAPAMQGTAFERALRQVMEERTSAHVEEHFAPFDTWYEGNLYPAPGGGISVYYREITDRKRLELLLRVSEAWFRALTENSLDTVTVLDAQGIIRYKSASVERELGWTAEELIGRNLLELTHPDDRPQVEAAFRALLEDAERKPRLVELRFRHADGSWRVLESLVQNHLHEPAVAGIVVNSRDVTDRKQAEAAGAEAEERRRLVVELSPDAYVEMDQDGRILEWNPAAEALFGWSRKEAVGREVADTVIPASFQTAHREGLQRYLATGVGSLIGGRVEVPAVRRDGDEFPVELTLTAIPTPAGVVFASFMHDISERKAAEAALEQAARDNARLAAAVENLGTGVLITDPHQPDDPITYANPGFAAITGYALEEVLGRNARFLQGPETDPALVREIREAIEERRPFKGRILNYRKDGTPFWNDMAVNPVFDAQGELISFVGLQTDVTHRVRAQEELLRAKEAAEEASRAKSEFLSRTSHELRTPLNAVLGFAQILEMDVEKEEDRESVEQILTAGRHLLSLVDEVLDLAKIEEGRLSVALEAVPVEGLLHTAVELVRPVASRRQVDLRLGAAGKPAVWAYTDQQRLKQVMLNLLSNAIKFNVEGGRVWVRCEPVSEERLRISVRDTGHGIPAEDLPRLFVPFDRLRAEELGIEGTGLGLALTKGLVEAIGGQIGVESVAGQGSTFWVELPRVRAPGEAENAATGPDTAGALGSVAGPTHTILYIEGNLANLRLVQRILARWRNVRLVEAMHGGIGLELAQETPPDLVLLDLNLPGVPGDEVLQRLKQDARLAGVPVVVISEDATDQQVARLRSLGAADYLSKPLDVERFLQVLDTLLA